ncbi:MAG: glutamate--tRNA ligase family protein [Candidatus Paceibacterota bacterium]|jgi:glutamyl-tRNA synthetase
MKNNIVTRFAPSPTGLLHAGNYRTAVFSYLFARQNKGKFILRIEDTDKERSKKEYADNIIESLKWLGLEYDETFYQSERAVNHQKYLEKLIAEDKAYVSKEEIKKEGDRTEVIRFRNPGKQVSFHDTIRGLITTDTTDLGDFVIAKSLTEPVFHLAVVIDDFEMGITQVIRGEDHISNTPRQILIQEAIGAPTPEYAHLPLVLAPDRSKLSKRRGALAITEYRDRGYLPEAVLNYMAMLGWNPGTDQEIFFKEELIKSFDLGKVQKGAAIFDQTKLDWFNREHLKRLSPESLQEKLKTFVPAKALPLAEILRERINNLGEAKNIIENGEFDFFFSPPEPTKELLKKGKFLNETIKILEDLPEEDFLTEKIKASLWDFATREGRAEVLWPMRTALTGKEKSPDPFTVAEVLGKEETLRRLKHAQKILN